MIDTVLALLKEKKYAQVKQTVLEMHEVDVAEIFEEISDTETMLRLFRLLPKETAAETFSYMEADVQQRIIEAITDKELRYILDDMYLDDYVDMIEEMPANVVKRVMNNSSRENRSLINQYLKYPERSAGGLMTNEYVYFKRTLTVTQAFDVIRNTGLDKETVYTCYVIDAQRHLEGTVSVLELLLAEPDARIEDLMEENPIYVQTLEDQEEVAKMFSRYDMIAMPVVDNEKRLVGIITIDDAIDVLQEENTEDFERMAGITASGDESYLKTPAWKLAKNRIVWLIILMLSAMVTGALLEHYEAAIATVPLLVSFIPMLMDTGGNCGSQASTTIIRGMALDEIEAKDFLKVWFKEIRVAMICAVVLSAVNFVRIWLQYGDVGVATVVSLTLIATICIAKSLGCVLPMLAKKLRLDPAIVASPMITTITDACSILAFFGIAVRLLSDRL
ncbi:MAG: magnesium transporter [Eubacteriales bacterium]|nr:magnesium transporter [Eubacteriales bacterium]